MWTVYHRIYEPAGPLGLEAPVVEHRFYGVTKAEAIRIYQAHRQTDAFLRGCDDRGGFHDITCVIQKEVGRVS